MTHDDDQQPPPTWDDDSTRYDNPVARPPNPEQHSLKKPSCSRATSTPVAEDRTGDAIGVGANSNERCLNVSSTSISLLEYYDRARALIVHEDTVFSARMGWVLMAQAVLLSTYGALSQIFSDSGPESPLHDVLNLMAIAGVGVCFFLLVSSIAVAIAMAKVRRGWSRLLAELVEVGRLSEKPKHFPLIQAGTSGMGLISGYGTIVLLAVIWVYLLLR